MLINLSKHYFIQPRVKTQFFSKILLNFSIENNIIKCIKHLFATFGLVQIIYKQEVE